MKGSQATGIVLIALGVVFVHMAYTGRAGAVWRALTQGAPAEAQANDQGDGNDRQANDIPSNGAGNGASIVPGSGPGSSTGGGSGGHSILNPHTGAGAGPAFNVITHIR